MHSVHTHLHWRLYLLNEWTVRRTVHDELFIKKWEAIWWTMWCCPILLVIILIQIRVGTYSSPQFFSKIPTYLLKVNRLPFFSYAHTVYVHSRRTVHWENYTSNSFQIEWDMIVVTVFLSILNTNKWNSLWFRKSKGKLSPRSYTIQFQRKLKYSFVSVFLSFSHGWAGVRTPQKASLDCCWVI